MARLARLTERERDIVRRTQALIYAWTGARDGGGWCGIGALIVHYTLGDREYQLMGSDGHWWVERRKDRAILDPTAGQFSMKNRWEEYQQGEPSVRREAILCYPFEYHTWGKRFARMLKQHYA